jgi:predicted DNA-binding antitoxin AbrB/MazE fold protein
MYKTIEAIYKNGRIYPIKEKISIKKAKVLLTIMDETEALKQRPRSYKIKRADLDKFASSITLFENPLAFQKRLRNEW